MLIDKHITDTRARDQIYGSPIVHDNLQPDAVQLDTVGLNCWTAL